MCWELAMRWVLSQTLEMKDLHLTLLKKTHPGSTVISLKGGDNSCCKEDICEN